MVLGDKTNEIVATLLTEEFTSKEIFAVNLVTMQLLDKLSLSKIAIMRTRTAANQDVAVNVACGVRRTDTRGMDSRVL